MDEFKMCCGTTCDKRKVQEQIDELRAALQELNEQAVRAMDFDLDNYGALKRASERADRALEVMQ